MFLQRQSPKKAGKEKLHFGLFLGLFFCSIITLKPLKTLRFQGFSVILQGLKGLQKIQFLRFRDLHTRMTVNQHCPEKINSTRGDKRRSLWYNIRWIIAK